VSKCVNIIAKKLKNYNSVINNDCWLIVVIKIIKNHLISDYIG